MWGMQLESPDQLVPALKTAFNQEGPALVAVPVDYSENMKLTERLGNVSIKM